MPSALQSRRTTRCTILNQIGQSDSSSNDAAKYQPILAVSRTLTFNVALQKDFFPLLNRNFGISTALAALE